MLPPTSRLIHEGQAWGGGLFQRLKPGGGRLPAQVVGIGPLGGLSARSFSVLTPWGFQVAPRRKTPGLKWLCPFKLLSFFLRI